MNDSLNKTFTDSAQPLVTVIIATYNRADFISRCIDSVLSQTYKNIEIIVIDDCSTDNTTEVLKPYEGRIKVIRNKDNKGISYNSNLGFSLSSGRFICLLGDDDYWLDEHKIELQVKSFEANKILGLSTTWWTELDRVTGIEVKKVPSHPLNLVERILSGGGLICGSAVMISRDAWENVGGFDEKKKRGTDSDLFRRIVLKGYDINIIKKITVSVDTSSDRKRMTSLENVRNIESHIESITYTLARFSKEYNQYPKAKAIYLEKLGWLYEQKLKVSNSGARDSIKYYFKSLNLAPTNIINFLRIIRVLNLLLRNRMFKRA